ncbi:MAG: 2-hydroxyacyl-CoA dehydratase [Chloroflexi bacterium]|nr:2-hydroxyacyl-CoA dehydratase [Chloroflexota bacterium]
MYCVVQVREPLLGDQIQWDWNSLAHPCKDWQTRYPTKRAFGYLCTYSPIELLHAAGFVPVRLVQGSGQVALANAHLPSFSCALARMVTERLLSGALDCLSGLLVVHTCDTMQCVADIWHMADPPFPLVTFSLPTVLSNVGARDYLLAELHRLAAVLESDFGAPVTEDALRTSIALYNEQRRLLATLYEHRRAFTVEQFWTLVLSGMVTPVEEHNVLLQSVLQSVEEKKEAVRQGPAVILVGAILDDPTIPVIVHELGGQVVWDDLCTGSRYFDVLVDETQEPFGALADRYLKRVPCPTKHDDANPRAEHLLSLVHRTGAQGVVFVLPKFCEPHAFDYVLLSKALANEGVPHLWIETDLTAPIGQLRTRIQAFIELLRGS